MFTNSWPLVTPQPSLRLRTRYYEQYLQRGVVSPLPDVSQRELHAAQAFWRDLVRTTIAADMPNIFAMRVTRPLRDPTEGSEPTAEVQRGNTAGLVVGIRRPALLTAFYVPDRTATRRQPVRVFFTAATVLEEFYENEYVRAQVAPPQVTTPLFVSAPILLQILQLRYLCEIGAIGTPGADEFLRSGPLRL